MTQFPVLRNCVRKKYQRVIVMILECNNWTEIWSNSQRITIVTEFQIGALGINANAPMKILRKKLKKKIIIGVSSLLPRLLIGKCESIFFIPTLFIVDGLVVFLGYTNTFQLQRKVRVQMCKNSHTKCDGFLILNFSIVDIGANAPFQKSLLIYFK